MGRTVLETFTIFPFSIVLALALGEAFKQCVADHHPEAADGGSIQWDRIPALLTFLLLILPFYQGMNRYLLLTYGGVPVSGHRYSAIGLIIDGLAFMIESAAFFAMSRNLDRTRWRYFYCIVLVLLLVDTCWGFSAQLRPYDKTASFLRGWMVLNLASSVVLFGIIFVGPKLKGWFVRRKLTDGDLAIAIIGTLAMLVRTCIDYAISWKLYFP
jgi:hypothetical protein